MEDFDKKIIDDVDKWKQQEFKLREEEIYLKDQREKEANKFKHERWVKFGRFLKVSVISIFCSILVAGSGFGIYVGCKAKNEKEAIIENERKAHESERKAQEEMLQKQYDLDWVSCVDSIGLEKCKTIREMSYKQGFQQGFADGYNQSRQYR